MVEALRNQSVPIQPWLKQWEGQPWSDPENHRGRQRGEDEPDPAPEWKRCHKPTFSHYDFWKAYVMAFLNGRPLLTLPVLTGFCKTRINLYHSENLTPRSLNAKSPLTCQPIPGKQMPGVCLEQLGIPHKLYFQGRKTNFTAFIFLPLNWTHF